jgi:outer membrane protein OmpA-like peptidoglycan-associated protein
MRALLLPTLAATLFGACAFTGAASLASDTSAGDGRLKLAQLAPKDSKEEEARKKKQQGGGRPQGEGQGQAPPARGQPPQGQPIDRGQRVQQPPVQRPLQTTPGGESQPKRAQPGGFTQQPRQVQTPQGEERKGDQPAFRRGQGGTQRGDTSPPVQRQLEGQPSGRGVPKQVERPPASDPSLLRKGDPRGDPRREDSRRSAEPQRPDDQRPDDRRFQGRDDRPQPGVRPGFGVAPDRARVGDQGRDRPGEGRPPRLEDMQKGRRERVEAGGQRRVIEEPDRRVIVRQGDRAIIRHDESARFRRVARDARTERRNDGTSVTIFNRRNGQVFSVVDADGRLIRRYRRTREGREVNLIDNRRHYGGGRRVALGVGLGLAVGLLAPRILIPREKYIVEYDGASYDDVYEALSAPPIEELDREYSLEEIRYSPHLRDRMRRVDLDVINFEFGSWEIPPDQYSRLEWVANAINRVLERNPDEIFLIEGHTDAVGSEEDNLSLSDRRAESVATVLSEQFDVPPENLVTQGYGEDLLKVPTEAAERLNRRVAVRRITPLMQKHLSAR